MSTRQELDGVVYETDGSIATVTLNRPEYRNAQNSGMLYALDQAFYAFAQDDELSVAVLRAAGPSFSSGHDLGSPGVDYDVSFPRQSMWWDHVGKEGAENWMAREEEIYLGLARRWREIPKPTIAMVQGACVAGGLMLAWPCDLIYASDDAYFSDPVVLMGVCGVELFAHPWELGVRQAKELLFTAGRIDAQRAYELGMVNRVFPLGELEERTYEIARRISEQPRFALALTKKAVNQAQDAMGYRAGIDAAFGLHQLAQVQNALTTGAPGLGQTASSMRAQTSGR
jgi:enoyl-CoA hydratase